MIRSFLSNILNLGRITTLLKRHLPMNKLYLTAHAHRKLKYFVNLCPQEISGFGKLEIQVIEGVKYFMMTDLEIFKQVCTSAHSTIDDDAMGKFLYDMTVKGEDLSKWKIWWHSHAKMKAFFSGTDTGTIDQSTEFPYLISLVSNHEGELVSRLDVFDPIRHHVDLQVEVLQDEDDELKALCQKEIDEKVTLEVPRPNYSHNYKEGAGFRTNQEITPSEKHQSQFGPEKGTKRWRKLKKSKGVITMGDPDFDWEDPLSFWDTDLQCFAIKKQTSTSKDNKTSTTHVNSKPTFPLSVSGTSGPKHVSDSDDLD